MTHLLEGTKIIFIERTDTAEWLVLWQSLTALLSGGKTSDTESITEKEIVLFCAGYTYEGTENKKHYFKKREADGNKIYIQIDT